MRYSAVTDKGLVRKENEDSIFASTTPAGSMKNLFMVADGMGGHVGGRYASRFVIDKMQQLVLSDETDIEDPARILTYAAEITNSELFEEAGLKEGLRGMGTTLVAATIADGSLYAINVGDSRLYLFDGELHQLTKDHSWVEEMIADGKIERDGLLYRMRKNIITRAVGIEDKVLVDSFTCRTAGVSRVLLCSDGLTNMLSDDVIAGVLSRPDDCDTLTELLIELSNEAGGSDNISVILIDL